MKSFFKKHFFRWDICMRVVFVLGGMLFANEALAATASTLTGIETNVQGGVKNIAKIMEDVSLVTGIGFIMGAFFKFHQHKLQPTQVPLSQGVTLLVIGSGLAVFPHLLSIGTEGLFGTGVGKVGGGQISTIIQ